MEKEYGLTLEKFKEAMAKEFNVAVENITVKKDNEKYNDSSFDFYGFEVQHKVVCEFITIADDRVYKALALDENTEYIENMNLTEDYVYINTNHKGEISK